MRFLAVLLLASGVLSASPYLTASQVYINGQGPYRFLVDTGAQSSAVTERLARTLGITPQYRVQQVTSAGSRLAGAAIVDRIAFSHAAVTEAEVLIGGMAAVSGVDGILGQSFLSRINYVLDYRSRQLVVEPDASAFVGDFVSFDVLNGRPAIEAEIGGRRRTVILDSGAPALVLFGETPLAARFASGFVQTNTGSAQANLGPEKVRIVDGRTRLVRAVYLPRPGPDSRASGLLPPSIFQWVYVDNTERFVVFSSK